MTIITYDHPHRKTQDLVFRFLAIGIRPKLLIIPWEERATRKVVQHRPAPFDITPQMLMKNFDLKLGSWDDDYVLIGGAGLFAKPEGRNIINCHPGYLPNVRGLDALKWAIYDGQPIGVTLHKIDENIDQGNMICRYLVPIYFEDTFHSLALRLYETEISIMVNFYNVNACDSLKDQRYKPRKRMPSYLDPIMLERFEQLRKNRPSIHSL